MFCQDIKFVHKVSSRRRVIARLQKCLTYVAVKKVINAAHARNDEGILRRIEGEDLIALDILYHKTRYATFTSKENIQQAMHLKLFQSLIPIKFHLIASVRRCIHTYIRNDKTVLPLSLLKSIYIKELNQNGVTISQYHTEK